MHELGEARARTQKNVHQLIGDRLHSLFKLKNGSEPTAEPRRVVPSTARGITGLKISVEDFSDSGQIRHLGKLIWAPYDEPYDEMIFY